MSAKVVKFVGKEVGLTDTHLLVNLVDKLNASLEPNITRFTMPLG